MSAFVPVDPATATGKAAELLAEFQKTLGLTPNMTKDGGPRRRLDKLGGRRDDGLLERRQVRLGGHCYT